MRGTGPTPAGCAESHLELTRELQTKLETLTYRNGYLESKLQERDSP